jgi:hypothetical protein
MSSRNPGSWLRLVSRQYRLTARFDTIPSRPLVRIRGRTPCSRPQPLAEHDVVDGQIGQHWRGDSGIVRRSDASMGLVLGDAKIGKTSKLEFFAETFGLETGGLAQLGLSYVDELLAIAGGKTTEPTLVTDDEHCVGASDDYSRPGRHGSIR